MNTAKALLIREDRISEIDVDARPMSTYTHDALGGTPTFIGAWPIGEDNMAYMLALREPAEDLPIVDPTIIPMIQREVRGPILVTALSPAIEPIDFFHDMLSRLGSLGGGGV